MQIAGRKARFDVLLTSYDFMMGKADRPRLAKLTWEYIIIDEGHRLKNAGCKLNAEIKMYSAHSRLLLTGIGRAPYTLTDDDIEAGPSISVVDSLRWGVGCEVPGLDACAFSSGYSHSDSHSGLVNQSA